MMKSKSKIRKLHIVFIHLDLGIGGAEQLILQLANASIVENNSINNSTSTKRTNTSIELITTRCEPDHCFASVKPNTGTLYPYLTIYGKWIPHNISFGTNKRRYGTALFSTIRLSYLTICIIVRHWLQQLLVVYDNTNNLTTTSSSSSSSSSSWLSSIVWSLLSRVFKLFVSIDHSYQSPDVIVMDVLSTPLPILRYLLPQTSVLFYCHFPDKLLVQQHRKDSTATNRGYYRQLLDKFEEWTMIYSDVTVVNSNFTKATVYETFPSLVQEHKELPVLYPALEIQTNNNNDNNTTNDSNILLETIFTKMKQRKTKLVLSLNRYERKKNLSLFIEAAAYIRDHNLLKSSESSDTDTVQFVIAGGYDVKNIENVEYRGELQQLATRVNVSITFLQSITDTVRTTLLQEASVVVYTPDNEHFGIVPLEAMYYGTPVIACASGGPLETILNEQTGYLCQPNSSKEFAIAISKVLHLSNTEFELMATTCHYHVINKFGPQRLVKEWNALIEQTIVVGTKRYELMMSQTLTRYWKGLLVTVIMELVLVTLIIVLVTYCLRVIGIVQPEQSIIGKIKSIFFQPSTSTLDEL